MNFISVGHHLKFCSKKLRSNSNAQNSNSSIAKWPKSQPNVNWPNKNQSNLHWPNANRPNTNRVNENRTKANRPNTKIQRQIGQV